MSTEGDAVQPLEVSRRLERVARRWREYQRLLAMGRLDAPEPFEAERPVLGRSAFLALSELPASDPLRRPLLRWCHRLAEQRIDRRAVLRVVELARVRRHELREPEEGAFTWAELRRRWLRLGPDAAGWRRALERCSPELSEAVGNLWERRREISRRLGLAHPDDLEAPAPELPRRALEWLERTDDAAAAGEPGGEPYLRQALGLAAPDGWPARLELRGLIELGALEPVVQGLGLPPVALPAPLGPASFLLGLARLGRAFALAAAPPRQPFVVAQDPYSLSEHVQATVCAAAPTTPPALRQRFGARWEDTRRALAVVVLHHSRRVALGVLLRAAALEGRAALREACEQHVPRVFLLDRPPAAPGVVPVLRTTAPARFAGLLLGAATVEVLREEHDEDWHRNPRAQEQRRFEALERAAPEAAPEALDRGAEVLWRELLAVL